MALARFSIIVAIDNCNGIARDGDIPWNSQEDLKFFKDTTIGNNSDKRKNAVIMGRVTYESIPDENRPLKNRHCAVISRTLKQEKNPQISIYASFVDALAGIGGSLNSYNEVFVIGGEHIYKEAIRDYLYLCNKIYVTKFKIDYNCNQNFPFDDVKDLKLFCDPVKSRDFTRYTYVPNVIHKEIQYINLLCQIKENGEQKPDRTGVGTKSIFGSKLEFDMSDERVPFITTKRLVYEAVIKELLFFISGKTNTKMLENQGVKIWKENTSSETLTKLGLTWNEGDMGPLYPHQWRHWGAEYYGCDEDYTGKGIDQLQGIIDTIRKDPFSRRLIMTAWNPSQIHQVCLPACHCMVQFNVSNDKQFLDCQVYQRSVDSFLGLPFNIASYAMLTYMIAHVCGLRPRKLIYIGGDTHIYNNHGEQVNKQIKRDPRPFPKLTFRESSKIHEIDDFTFESFNVEGYSSWPMITAEMAV